MTRKSHRKSYSAFIGSLTASVCLAAYLSYSGEPGSDIRIWLSLSILSIALQALITGQQGFEKHRTAGQNDNNQTQEESYFYCGATFEDGNDPKDEIFNPVFSNELMIWRAVGFTTLLASYVFCLKNLPGFQFHFSDVAFLIGLTVILYASTLRHFLLAMGLVSWVVMVHQFSGIERSNAISVNQWLWLGGYSFLTILTLQLHRILDLEVRDPEADLLKHPRKKHELLIGSLTLFAFAASLVVLSNWIVPKKAAKREPQHPVSTTKGLAIQQALVDAGQNVANQAVDQLAQLPKKVSISQEEAMRLLQSLQSKANANLNANGANSNVNASASANANSNLNLNLNPNINSNSNSELSLPTKLELEGLVRKDLEGSAARPDQQVELSKETIASIQQALEQQSQAQQKMVGALNSVPSAQSPASDDKPLSVSPSQNMAKKSELRAELEKVQAQVSSQLKAQSNENATQTDSDRSLTQLQSKPKALPQAEQKRDLRGLFDFLRRAMVILALFVIVNFVAKILRKRARPEEIYPSAPELSDEDKARLKKEWKALQKQKLSTREEVIACYHFFLKVMHSLGHERPESLPPIEYATTLEPYFKPQSVSIGRLTGVFCDVFYGKEDPDSAHLKEFRADFGSICRGLL